MAKARNSMAVKGSSLWGTIAGVLTKIAKCSKLDPPDPDVEMFDDSDLDTEVGRRMSPTGYVKGGVYGGKLWFATDNATHAWMTSLIANPQSVTWEHHFSDETAWPFDGTLTKFKPTGEMNGGVEVEFEITLDGLVDYPE